jgi:hypothetical protein
MKRFTFFLALVLAGGASAQAPPPSPPADLGPAAAPMRGGLWQILTPEQRAQLWRTLSPEQKADLWRGLEAQERREMRERLGPPPNPPEGIERPWGPRHPLDQGDGPPRVMMTPEERQQMREQIREAHRLRRERFEAERERGRRPD